MRVRLRAETRIAGVQGVLSIFRAFFCVQRQLNLHVTQDKGTLRPKFDQARRNAVAHCVEHAIVTGNKADQRLKIEELMSLTTTDMSGVWR